MKDENKGVIMIEFVGLGVKMYSLRTENEREIKKSKGFKKMALDRINLTDNKITLTACIHLELIDMKFLLRKQLKLFRTYAWGHWKLKIQDANLHDIAYS